MQDVQKTLAGAKIDNAVVNGVASVVAKNYTLKKRKRIIYLTLLTQYGRKDGLQLYNLIKRLL